jgi:hypothetical protein
MKLQKLAIMILGVAGFAIAPVLAQEGYPLAGTWHGEWKTASGQRTQIAMYIKWDGKSATGILNPGPNAAPVTATVQGWNVHLEAKVKDAQMMADGKMDKVGSSHRIIKGDWMQGTAKGEFTLTRD